MTSPLRPAVTAAFRAFTVPLEGKKSWLYLCAAGLPTVGIGCALTSADQSARLNWLRTDGSLATDREIWAEWEHLHGMQHLAGTTAESQREHVALHIGDEEIERLFWRRVEQTGTALVGLFPDFPTYPAPAQFALLSMGFAMGTGKFAQFVRMRAALAVRDWPSVARECFMQGKGLVERNAANRRLFLCAAACEADDGDPDALDLRTPTLADLEARFLAAPAPSPTPPADGPVPGAWDAVAVGWQAGVTNERNPER